jgi:hypothetical protein
MLFEIPSTSMKTFRIAQAHFTTRKLGAGHLAQFVGKSKIFFCWKKLRKPLSGKGLLVYVSIGNKMNQGKTSTSVHRLLKIELLWNSIWKE